MKHMKIYQIIAAACLSLGLLSCSEKTISVTGVSLGTKSLSMEVGDVENLVARVEPADATNADVDWESTDPTVATVTRGVVHAVNPGLATVIATTVDGRFSDRCQVKVNASVQRIELEAVTLTLKRGDFYQLHATVTPANASNPRVTWKSNAPEVAAVSENGFVVARAAGTAEITATTEDGGLTATCIVTVTRKVSGLALSPQSLDLVAGDEADLQAHLSPEGTEVVVRWDSTDPDVVSVDANGHVRATGAGDAYIIAATEYDAQQAFCEVHVRKRIQAVAVSAASLEVNRGKTVQMTATVVPADAADYTVTWSSDDPSIAAVNERTGVVTGKAKGTVSITATVVNGSQTETGSALVKVLQPVTSISVSPEKMELFEGDSFDLSSLTVIVPEEADIKTVTYKSKSGLVEVRDGKVVALTPGTDVLEIYPVNGDPQTLHAECSITVKSRVTGIKVTPRTLTLTVGDSDKLSATVVPDDASNKRVTWSSSNESVATVDAEGNVKALKAGSAIIAATSEEDESKRGTCAVTVLQVESVTLNASTISLEEEKTFQLTATVKPDGLSDKSVEWSSSNPAVASVSAEGLVTARTVGTATITATSKAYPQKTATCSVSVSPKYIAVTGVVLNQTRLSLTAEDTYSLVATVSPSNATDPVLEWTSSNSGVATVDASGHVTAVAAGTATITAKSKADPTKTAVCSVTVAAKVIHVTGVTLPATATVERGSSITLTATVTPANADNPAVSWSTSDASVATVNTSTGRVTGAKVGTAVITATTVDGKFTASCTVTVTEPPVHVSDVTLSQTTATLVYGGTLNLATQVTVNPEDATDKSVTWSSSNPNVASVTDGVVVAGNTSGTAVITVSSVDKPEFKATCTVTVKAQIILVENITISPSIIERIYVGQTVKVTATATPANADNKDLVWSVNNGGCIRVDSEGNVTPFAAGTSRLIVSAVYEGRTTATRWIHVYSYINAVASVSLPKTALTLKVGEEYPLKETVTAVDPSAPASNPKVSWKSSDISVATVNSEGLITAKEAGTATITVTSASDSSKKATCTLTVIAAGGGNGTSEGVEFDDWTF